MSETLKRVFERKITLKIILGLLVLCSYSNVYDMVFVYDDEFYIQKNQFLNSFENLGKLFLTNSTAGSGFEDSFYRPLQFTFYLFSQQIFGSDPWGFHLLNVMLHLFNALLVFGLGRKIGLKQTSAFFAAALWATHPIHTEVIAYISGTADPLQCLFSLLALTVMLRGSKYSVLFSCVFFLLAMLSKEVAVVFPGLATALLFLTSKKKWHWETYKPVALYFLMALIYVGLRATILNFNGDFQFYKTQNIYTENFHVRLFTFLATIPEYLKLIIWPVNLHIDRAFPIYTSFAQVPVILGLAIFIFQLLACGWLWRHHRKSGVVFIAMTMWFAAAHSLHSGILVPMNSFFLEHWLYVPSIAIFWTVGFAFNKIPSKIAATITILCVFILGTLTYKQNRMWESPITLFSRILQFNPNATRVRHNLAMAYSDQGQEELALKEYEKSLEQEPQTYPQTYHNMALIYLERNDLKQGEKLLLKAIEISPRFHPSYPYLIQLYRVTKQVEKEKEWQQKYKTTFGRSL